MKNRNKKKSPPIIHQLNVNIYIGKKKVLLKKENCVKGIEIFLLAGNFLILAGNFLITYLPHIVS